MDVLFDPLVQRGSQLLELVEALLALSVEQRVSGRRFGEDVVQLGDVRNDGLLVGFGGINIYKKETRNKKSIMNLFRGR